MLLFVLSTLTAVAQKDKEEVKEEEKPQVGTLEKAWKPVIMEHYLGIRGGYGIGSVRMEPTRQSINKSGLLNFGLSYKFDAIEQKYVGCIEVNLSYMQKGFQYETYSESGIIYSRTYNVVELPILWQPYLPLSSKNSANRFFINAGPYISYALDSKERTYEQDGDVTITEGKYFYNGARDNRFEYGIVVGGGIQVAIKRVTIAVDFRYNIMLSDVMKSVTKYPSNPFRSPVDHMNISFAIGYKLRAKKTAEVL